MTLTHHRSKKRVTGNRKKNGFSAKKLAENAKSMKFALPCGTNIVILPKVWPVRNGLPDH